MTAPSTARGIDPRGPRFSAGVTAILFLLVIALALLDFGTAALILSIYNAAVFLWGAAAGVARHPYVLFVPFGPIALIVAGAAAFLAAFLNSVFAYCLGCQIYLLLARVGILGRKGAAAA
jgi:hypothetical protein